MSAEDIVIVATEELFNEKDPAAVSRHFGPYTEHSARGADGLKGLRLLAENLPDDSRYALVRALADGDIVVTHGVFHGLAEHPMVAVDLWRVEGDTIVEHWDSLLPVADETEARVRTEGSPRNPETSDASANRALIAERLDRVVLGEGSTAFAEVVSDTLVDHGSGLSEVLAGRPSESVSPRFTKVHRVLADGDLVYSRIEGDLSGPVVVNDLWRLEEGRIVEHWGLVVPVPARLPHGNSVF